MERRKSGHKDAPESADVSRPGLSWQIISSSSFHRGSEEPVLREWNRTRLNHHNNEQQDIVAAASRAKGEFFGK